MRRLLPFVLFAVLATSSAHAAPTPCFGLHLAEAWKQGYEAFAAGHYDQAQDILEPLAENGFAPAQWLVGRMVAEGQGAQKDEITGLMWLKLAGLAQIKQARPFASQLETRLDMAGFEQARRRQESWRAKHTLSSQDAAPVPPNFGDDGTTKKPSQQLMRWWSDFVIDATQRSPEAMPYLMTLPAVVFVGEGANSAVMRHKGMPILLVNESLAERTMPESLEAILPAAREAVNEAALAAVFPTPVETYKGRTLRGHPSGDNQAFTVLMRKAIDMTDKLPPALRQKAGRITQIRYEPAFVHGAARSNSNFSAFDPDAKISGGGTMVFQVNPAMSSPAQGVMGLVQSATLAGRPDLNVEKASPQQAKTLRCLLAADAAEVAKALDMSPDIQSAINRERRQINCD